MRGFGFSLRHGFGGVVDVLVLATTAAFLTYLGGLILGFLPPLQVAPEVALLIYVSPLLLAPWVILRRKPLSTAEALALGGACVATGALYAGLLTLYNPIQLVVIPIVGLSAVICARFPAASLAGAFLLCGAYGSLTAFVAFPAQKSVDVLLAGLWLAALWVWLIQRQRRPAWVWPGVVAVGLYVAFSAVEIFTADTFGVGMRSFRVATWYLAVVLLIAYAPWSPAARRRLTRAVIAIATLAGAYAALRWIIGPAGAEHDNAARFPNNFLDGKLRPVGSFVTAKELAAYSATMLPFLVACALAIKGRWRLVAIAGVITTTTAMLAADVRAGPASAVPGVVLVLVLFQLSQGFRGTRRGLVTLAAVLAGLILAIGAFALTVGGNSDSGSRYSAILHPSSDASYQARLFKWHTALDDIDRHPLGHGLGTAGQTQERFGQFVNINSIDVDNSYLKVAYEQGFGVMVFYGVAAALLMFGLAKRALLTHDGRRAGLAIGACGTLTAMLLLFYVGNYVEGLTALAGWILVGIGVSQFTGALDPIDGGE